MANKFLYIVTVLTCLSYCSGCQSSNTRSVSIKNNKKHDSRVTDLKIQLNTISKQPQLNLILRITNTGKNHESRIIVGVQAFLENDNDPKGFWSLAIDQISAISGTVSLSPGSSKTIHWIPNKEERGELKEKLTFRFVCTTLENANSSGSDFYSKEFKL